MIWVTVSYWSCFCWLYRASPSLAAKNIINLILVLTIWWCPCVESNEIWGSLKMNSILYKTVVAMGNITISIFVFYQCLLKYQFNWWNDDLFNVSLVCEKIFIDCPPLLRSGNKILRAIHGLCPHKMHIIEENAVNKEIQKWSKQSSVYQREKWRRAVT